MHRSAYSFSHIGTHTIFTNHVRKVVELLFFETGSIAVSEMPIGCVFIVSHCIIFRNEWDTDNEMWSYRKNDIKIFWVSDVTFLAPLLPPVSVFVTFLSTPFPVLKWWSVWIAPVISSIRAKIHWLQFFDSFFKVSFHVFLFCLFFKSVLHCQIYYIFYMFQIH